jgi:septum formation protein
VKDLILASGSAYRRDMLARLELPFAVHPADIDETPAPGETAAALAMRLGLEKAAHVARTRPDTIVIGSDQVAECNGRLLGKPGSIEKAVEQLNFCNGREVVFHSSVAVIRDNEVVGHDVVPTRVCLRKLRTEQIRRYVMRERPIDCAGAMKSEALGIILAASITSDDPTALIGLPLIATVTLLEAAGVEIIQP